MAYSSRLQSITLRGHRGKNVREQDYHITSITTRRKQGVNVCRHGDPLELTSSTQTKTWVLGSLEDSVYKQGEGS